MLTFEQFTGINNVLPEQRMGAGDLLVARDVDIGLTGEVSRRQGFTQVSDQCHKNLHQSAGYMLATVGAQLVAIRPDGARHVVHPAIGPERVWFCNLPDGRTTFTNGLLHGVTDGLTGVDRTVDVPASLGAPGDAFGALNPGQYRYHLTYTRLADRLESAPISSAPVATAQGGLHLGGLPVRDGHVLNIYLSGLDGEGAYLAGTTPGSSFEYTGTNAALVLPCRTLGAQPFPVGTYTAFWRGRVLTAVGNVLWASRPQSLHLTEWRDFKALPGAITGIVPVGDGVYVGTTEDLIFLGGSTWDQLSYQPTQRGSVTPGSAIAAPGEQIKVGDGAGNGQAMLCIAGGEVVAGFAGGQVTSLTGGRYKCGYTEVCATFREANHIPQYMAVPQ